MIKTQVINTQELWTGSSFNTETAERLLQLSLRRLGYHHPHCIPANQPDSNELMITRGDLSHAVAVMSRGIPTHAEVQIRKLTPSLFHLIFQY